MTAGIGDSILLVHNSIIQLQCWNTLSAVSTKLFSVTAVSPKMLAYRFRHKLQTTKLACTNLVKKVSIMSIFCFYQGCVHNKCKPWYQTMTFLVIVAIHVTYLDCSCLCMYSSVLCIWSVCLSVFSNGQMDLTQEKRKENSQDWNINSILEAVRYLMVQMTLGLLYIPAQIIPVLLTIPVD